MSGSTEAWVGGVVGGVVGFYLGGPVGAGYGFAIGFGLGSALTPMDAPETVQHDTGLQSQTSQRGAPIPVVFGARRVPGNIIWYGNFQKTEHEQSSGGKGAAPQGASTYTYSASFAIAICVGEIASIGRIWADKDEIDMENEGSSFVIYKGTSTQTPDSHMSSFLDRNSAYRGVAYVVFYNYDLGGQTRIPNFTFEVYGLGLDEESVTEDIAMVEMAAVETSSGYGIDTAVLYSRNRIFFGDNSTYKYSMWKNELGTETDSLSYLQNAAPVNGNRLLYGGEASEFSSKEVTDGGSFSLGITQSEMFAFATDQYATVHRYDILSDTMAPFAYCLTAANTLYTSIFKAQDCSWRNDCEFLALAVPNMGLGYGGVITYGWTAIASPNGQYIYHQAMKEANRTSTESMYGCYSVDWNATTDNIVAITENRIMIVYNFNLAELAIRHVDADCDMENPYSPYHFQCKWNSAGDRIAVSHRSVSSRALTIYKFENNIISEDCWINVEPSSGSAGLRGIQWDTDDQHIYAVNDDFAIQYIYDSVTSTLSERAARCNSQFEGTYYCAYDSSTSRLIVGGQQHDFLGSFKTRRTTTGSADVSPPLVTKTLLTNKFWGGGIDSSYIVDSVFVATQEYCIENDYLVAPVFRNASSILDNLDNMVGYHDGYITCIDNLIRHEQLEAEDATVIITDDDEITGGELGIAKNSERDIINRVRIAYTNRADTYTCGVVQRDAFAEQDYSGLRSAEVSMDAFTNPDRADKMAQRLLKKRLNQPLQMAMTVGPKLKGKLTPGGVFEIDHTVTGISSLKGRIASISESPESTLQIEFREEKDFLYDTTIQNPPTTPVSPPVDPYNLRDSTEDVDLYLIERPITKLGDATNIIVGVTSQVSDSSYSGARLYQSIDDATYTDVNIINGNAITGTVTNVDTSPGYFKSLTVTLNEREQSFVSYSSRDNFTKNNVNFALWDDRKVRFQTITSQGSLSYLLENILVSEKLNGTGNTTTNDIVFLTYGNLELVPYDIETTVDRYYKAPSFNFSGVEQSTSSLTASQLTIGKESLQLKPVDNLGIVVNSLTYDFGTNAVEPPITVSWRPRSRIEGFGKKGFGTGGFGHSLTDDIVGYQVYVNGTNIGVHSETTFTHSLSSVSFVVRQVGNTYKISDPKTIAIS